MHVVIAGGGVTGLTAAFRLLSAGRPDLRVTVLEAGNRLGGSLVTVRRDGLVLDGGADAFVATKPHALELCRELGLGSRLQETRPQSRNVYFSKQGRLMRLPEGVVLGVPTRFWPLLKSPLFSLRGVARMGLDLLVPRRADSSDESIASFLERRLGREAVEIFGEPLLGGIYSGDPQRLSIQSTFPQLVELEKRHRSLVLGALAARAKAPRPRAGHPPASPFLALRGGMGELIDILAAKVRALGGEVRLGAALERVTPGPERAVSIEARLGSGTMEEIVASHVLLCLPAPLIARALEAAMPQAARELRAIPQVSTASCLLAFDRSAIPHPMDAAGILLPRVEGRDATAITFMSSKWEGRAPASVALLRVFFGGHAHPEVRAMTDSDLVELARASLRAVLDVRAEPRSVDVFRWNDCRPQPVLGHAARVGRIRASLHVHPGISVAGAAFDGVGIPDCIRQANDAARAILAALPQAS